jgi:hypothetical protein
MMVLLLLRLQGILCTRGGKAGWLRGRGGSGWGLDGAETCPRLPTMLGGFGRL